MVEKLIELCEQLDAATLRKGGRLAACSEIEAAKPPLKA